jgi:predicted ATP-dependent serine protease
MVQALELQINADSEWQNAIAHLIERGERSLGELRELIRRHRALLNYSLFQSLLGNDLSLREGEELYLELLAVLEKRVGIPFGGQDAFLNMAGGIRVDDPAIDLAIIAALISSRVDVAIPTDICFAGEIGLSGEIRAVNRIEQRIQEADRLGFRHIFISKYNKIKTTHPTKT